MTNKTLSQELCEIAGIKPITTVKSCTSWNFQNIKDCSECKYECEDKKFPDFENNNDNFVRLLECLRQATGGCIKLKFYGVDGTLDDIKYRLELIKIKTPIPIDKDKNFDIIAKALQSEKWSY